MSSIVEFLSREPKELLGFPHPASVASSPIPALELSPVHEALCSAPRRQAGFWSWVSSSPENDLPPAFL